MAWLMCEDCSRGWPQTLIDSKSGERTCQGKYAKTCSGKQRPKYVAKVPRQAKGIAQRTV